MRQLQEIIRSERGNSKIKFRFYRNRTNVRVYWPRRSQFPILHRIARRRWPLWDSSIRQRLISWTISNNKYRRKSILSKLSRGRWRSWRIWLGRQKSRQIIRDQTTNPRSKLSNRSKGSTTRTCNKFNNITRVRLLRSEDNMLFPQLSLRNLQSTQHHLE